MTIVTSKDNPRIKQVRALLAQRKARDASQLFVAEGIRHVGEACASDTRVEYILYSPQSLTSPYAQELVRQQEQTGTPCLAVSEQVFNSLADKDNPAGILAVVRQPHLTLEDLVLHKLQTWVALVAPQDPGNIGSILRSIDATRASGLLLLDDPAHDQYCADPYHPSAVRASMGAIFWLPMVKTDFATFINWAKRQGVTLYGTSAHASLDYCQVKGYQQPLVLLMGSERQGLHPDQFDACDVMVKMPMLGRVTSLNLAAATTVMLYKILEMLA